MNYRDSRIWRDPNEQRQAAWYDLLKTLPDGSVIVHMSGASWQAVAGILAAEEARQPFSGGRSAAYGPAPQNGRGYVGRQYPGRFADSDEEDRPTPSNPDWHAAQVLNFCSLHPGLSTLPPHIVNPLLDQASSGRAKAGTIINAIKEGDLAYLLTIPQIGDKSANAILTTYRSRSAMRFTFEPPRQPQVRRGNETHKEEGEQ